MDEGMFEVAYFIYKFTTQHNKSATVTDILSICNNTTYTKEIIINYIKDMDYWGHIKYDLLPINGDYIRAVRLSHPETIRDYAINRGWMKVEITFIK